MTGLIESDRKTEIDMTTATIQDWTDSIVLLKFDHADTCCATSLVADGL